MDEHESNDLGDRKIRAASIIELGSKGNVLAVNEGHHQMDMQAWYFDIETPDSVTEIPRHVVLQEVAKQTDDPVSALKSAYDGGRDSGIPSQPDPPGWVQGVVDEEMLGTEDIKLEFEYMMNDTAMAKRFVDGKPEDTEVWVLGVDPGMRLLAKMEKKDRFSSREWVEIGGGSGRYVVETEPSAEDTGDDGDSDGINELASVGIESFEYDHDDGYDIGESRLKDAIIGVYGRLDDAEDGYEFDVSVERTSEDGTIRIVVDDAVYYYWFEDIEAVAGDFAIPSWAVMMGADDGIVDL